MIDENNLIKVLKKKADEETRLEGVITYEGEIHSDGFVSGVLWSVEAVKQQPKTCEWIPISERLPDNDDMMMVTCRTKAGRSSVNRAYCDDKGFWHGSGSMSGVVAWMPLPEPWEGEK